jgi:hypothetical protein
MSSDNVHGTKMTAEDRKFAAMMEAIMNKFSLEQEKARNLFALEQEKAREESRLEREESRLEREESRLEQERADVRFEQRINRLFPRTQAPTPVPKSSLIDVNHKSGTYVPILPLQLQPVPQQPIVSATAKFDFLLGEPPTPFQKTSLIDTTADMFNFAAPVIAVVVLHPIMPIPPSADFVAATEEEVEDLDFSAGVKSTAAPFCEAQETSNSPINVPRINLVKATAAIDIAFLPDDAASRDEMICGEQCTIFDPGIKDGQVGNRKTMVLRSDTRNLASQSSKHDK